MKKNIPIIILIILIAVSSLYAMNNRKIFLRNKERQEKEIKISDNIFSESIFKDYYKKAKDKVNDMTTEEKVGQLFLVRYEKNDTTYLNNFYPGGYILFAKDFNNHTKEEMKSELDNLQSISKYPLILGVDEEGGYVTRVSRYPAYRSEKFLSPRTYYDQGGYDLLEQTEKEKKKYWY